jgi:UDP-N-acetylglucosamine 2-epimerase (non-hydrolysing)
MKVAPVYRALSARRGVRQSLIHTGQHYDFNMSEVFFQQLEVPVPDVNLQVGSGTHAQQTSQIINRFEPVLLERKPDLVLVYGDVNSTVAAALVCAKLMIPFGHVEAGLRSFDRSMPEEINRLLTDQVADLLFTPSEDGDRNLVREGAAVEKIHRVGNVMIDTLVRMLPAARQSIPTDLPERYIVVTLHRPSNVDDLHWLPAMLATLSSVARHVPILFPAHPRTRRRLAQVKWESCNGDGLRLLDPLPYIDFLGLQTRAALVITDSGGIQEETTFLGVPCLTVRTNTERPVTVEIGTNVLVGRDLERIRRETVAALAGKHKPGSIPPLWDGHASERIAAVLTS